MWFVIGILMLFVRVSARPSILKHPRIGWYVLYWSLMVIIGFFVAVYIVRIMDLHNQ
jgi:hypothetical protein